ncbi:MAG: hypothetical protein MUP14_04240 [Dehalococcoidia bacterium]|nr:hypothetical protein [Dehalococcoidia bacterium]
MAGTATIAIRRPMDPAVKLARAQGRQLRDAQLTQVLLDPQVLGLLTFLGGLYAAQRIPWSEDDARRDMITGIASGGVVLMALSRAGLGSTQALAAAVVAGALSLEGGGGDGGTTKPPISLDWKTFWHNITPWHD